MALEQTSAGNILYEEIKRRLEHHEKEMADLRKEMAHADEYHQSELELERAQMQHRFEILEEDRMKLERKWKAVGVGLGVAAAFMGVLAVARVFKRSSDRDTSDSWENLDLQSKIAMIQSRQEDSARPPFTTSAVSAVGGILNAVNTALGVISAFQGGSQQNSFSDSQYALRGQNLLTDM